MERKPFSALVGIIHGVYYLITGIWPIVSRRSFERITGPKYDFWLVRTMGGMIGVIGAVLLIAGLRGKVTPELTALGIGSAASLGGSDVNYSARGRIPRVYMAESLAEFGLIGLWLAGLWLDSRRKPASVLQFSPEQFPPET